MVVIQKTVYIDGVLPKYVPESGSPFTNMV